MPTRSDAAADAARTGSSHAFAQNRGDTMKIHVISAAPAAAAAGTQVKAPMPGTILKSSVAVGDAVKSGDVLVVLEAMKMENDIVAPCDAKVVQVLVSKGSTVNTDDVLVVLG
ncbi:MAG: biotin/lipoyl-containing protein [Angelakisella sp.]